MDNVKLVKCACVNVDIQSYSNTILIPIPYHMDKYKIAREKEGLSPFLSIDKCIIEEIKKLWSIGIITYGSCCGHNKKQSFVNVSNECIDIMLEMGYVQNHPDDKRKDTFRLKSAG